MQNKEIKIKSGNYLLMYDSKKLEIIHKGDIWSTSIDIGEFYGTVLSGFLYKARVCHITNNIVNVKITKEGYYRYGRFNNNARIFGKSMRYKTPKISYKNYTLAQFISFYINSILTAKSNSIS